MRTIIFAGLLVALSLVVGCSPMYVAPAANAPLFGSGGELHGAVHVESPAKSLDLQGAFSPFKHFGILASVSTSPWKKDWHRHSYGELALGAYVPFGIGRFEVFAGGGYGKAWGEFKPFEGVRDDVRKVDGSGKYSRAFVQADIGLSTRVVDFGLMSRWCWVWIDYVDEVDPNLSGSYDTPFLEEMLFFRVGWDFLKFEFQGGFIWPTNYRKVAFVWIPYRFSIGLHVKFDLWGGEDDEEPPPPPPPSGEGGDDGGWGPAPTNGPSWNF